MTSFDLTTILTTILGIIATSGAITYAFRSGRKKAQAEADTAATAARTEEFQLLREQIELNQQQNMELIQMLNERDIAHNAQLADKEARFADQTDRLREVQRALVAANEREIALTRQLAAVTRQRDYWKLWHCRRSVCTDGREPPQDILAGQTFDPAQAGEPHPNEAG